MHPLQCKAIASARLKNDKAGAAILAQLLRADLLPEAWIAPLEVRQLPALLRHRIQLVRLRTLLRNRIHAVLAGHGHGPAGGLPAGRAGPGSRPWTCPPSRAEVVSDALALIDALESVIGRLDAEIRGHAQVRPAGQRLTRCRGPFTAVVLLAEIGDISRFASARKLASWAGLTPTVRGQRPHRPARAHLQDGMCGRNGSAASTGRCAMAVAGGFDLHRGQLTFDYIDTGTGESWRGRISLRTGRPCAGGCAGSTACRTLSSRSRGAPGGGTSWRNCSGPGSPRTSPSPPRRRAGGAASAAPRRTGLMPVIFVICCWTGGYPSRGSRRRTCWRPAPWCACTRICWKSARAGSSGSTPRCFIRAYRWCPSSAPQTGSGAWTQPS